MRFTVWTQSDEDVTFVNNLHVAIFFTNSEKLRMLSIFIVRILARNNRSSFVVVNDLIYSKKTSSTAIVDT